jgi:hypothetical protein
VFPGPLDPQKFRAGVFHCRTFRPDRQTNLGASPETTNSVALAAIVGVIVMMYAYVFPHLIPHGLTLVR